MVQHHEVLPEISVIVYYTPADMKSRNHCIDSAHPDMSDPNRKFCLNLNRISDSIPTIQFSLIRLPIRIEKKNQLLVQATIHEPEELKSKLHKSNPNKKRNR